MYESLLHPGRREVLGGAGVALAGGGNYHYMCIIIIIRIIIIMCISIIIIRIIRIIMDYYDYYDY